MIERLVRDGTAVARSDGTTHSLFPVAVPAAEGEASEDGAEPKPAAKKRRRRRRKTATAAVTTEPVPETE